MITMGYSACEVGSPRCRPVFPGFPARHARQCWPWLLCNGAGSPTFGQVRGRAPRVLCARGPPVGELQEWKMNKRDLIDAISGRLGDKKSATEAVNAVLDTIQDAVAKGDKVAITGFGVFEKSERPARTARNPATGATIEVPKSSVPKFRPGADFKALVNGDKK